MEKKRLCWHIFSENPSYHFSFCMKSFFSCVCSGTLSAEYCKCGKDSDKFARTGEEQCNCVVSTKASLMTKLSKDMEHKAFFNLMTAIQFLPLLVI